jgi:hypothetical protein
MTTPYETGPGFFQFIRGLFERAGKHQSRVVERLPSDTPGLSFSAVIDVTWENRATGMHHRSPEDATKDHVRSLASGITAQMSVLDPLAAQRRLNTQLGYSQQVPNRPAIITYATAALTVDEDTIRTAKESEENRAKLDSWRLLKDHVLADPVMACVWWLADHPERLEKLPDMGPAFDRLAALTTATDGHANDLLRVADVLDRFVSGLEAIDRQRLIENAAHVITSYGRPDLANELKDA